MIQSISGTTTVVGVLGFPVAHSLSPVMHNAAFAALGLDWVYVPFPVAPDRVTAAVSGLSGLGIRGVNVTIPHKQAVLPLLDRLTPEAEQISSVNTIAVTEAGLLGHSTDGTGFLRALTERGFCVAGAQVVVLGAGGAARAVVGALASSLATSVTLVARTPERGEALAALALRVSQGRTHARVVPFDDEARYAVAQAQLLVNTTPVGMAPYAVDDMPIPPSWLHRDLLVYDLVYTPRETALLHAAAGIGCRTIDGVAMLVYQGAEAFSLWTGAVAPITIMESAVTDFLRQASSSIR